MKPIIVKAQMDVTVGDRTYARGDYFLLPHDAAVDLARRRVVSLTQPPLGQPLSPGRSVRRKDLTPEPPRAEPQPDLEPATEDTAPRRKRTYRRRDLVAES